MKHRFHSVSLGHCGRAISTAGVCLTVVLMLTIFSYGAAAPPWQTSSPDSPSPDHMSQPFLQSATSALISIHQAKQNIADVVARNLPIGYYDPSLGARAYDQVRQAQIVATTNGDQQAAAELNSYFMKVRSWGEKYKSDRESMNATNTMGMNLLAQDPGWQAIEQCEKAINAMLTSRVYTSIASCQ